MADDEYSTPLPQGAQVGTPPAPSGGQNQQQPDNSGGDEYSTPIPQGAQIEAPASQDKSFQTPGGRSYQVGQEVEHSSGATGTVTGQHPDSGNAIINWMQNKGIDTSPITGFAKGLGDTAKGLSDMTGFDKTDLGKKLNQINTEPSNTGESIAKAGEAVSEIVAGDGALKGLGIADRMLESGKVMQMLEKYPTLAKYIHAGASALKMGTIGGIQGTVKSGGDIGQGAQEGLGAAAGAGILGAGSAAVGGEAAGGLSDVKDVAQQGLEDIKNLPEKVATTARKVYPEAIPPENPVTAKNAYESRIQTHYDDLHGHLQSVANKVADEEGVADKIKPAASVRDYFHNVGDAVEAKAKSLYQNVDNAMKKAGIAQSFQKIDATIDDLGDQMDAAHDGGNKKLYDELDAQMQQQVKLRESIKPALKAAGVPEDAPDEANRVFKKAQALKDLGIKTTASTDGLRPEFADASSTPERVDPKKLHGNIEKLYDNKRYGGRRLQQALGDDAGSLLRKADDTKVKLGNEQELEAQRKVDLNDKRKDVKTQRRVVQGAATAATAGLVGKELVHHASTAAEIAAGAQ